MAWNHPTPQESLERIQAQMDIELPNADSRIRRSVESVIARVIVMAARELLGFVSYISKQILVSTADEENLERHGSEWGIARKAATAASGTISLSGTNGSIIPAGSVFKRADNLEYALSADVTIAGGVGNGLVVATQSGAASAAAAGTKLTLTSPIAGVNSEALAQAPGLTGGADIESLEEWRARIIERKQRPPHGGSAYDYEIWAKEVAGVTRAFSYPNQYGLGTVGLTFVMDNKVGTIIPSAGEVTAVRDHILVNRPVTAELTVFAPVAVPVNFTINLSPNTLAIQNAVKAEVEDFIKREAVPGGTIYLSRLREAISSAAGEFDNVLMSPNANIVSAFGEIPVVGTFTFGGI